MARSAPPVHSVKSAGARCGDAGTARTGMAVMEEAAERERREEYIRMLEDYNAELEEELKEVERELAEWRGSGGPQ
ncbi:MAG: hypothetical protein HYX89_05925 [Chloroflexi bacterium]|nr:hypothetical protein [Chloroflexota bacterium]